MSGRYILSQAFYDFGWSLKTLEDPERFLPGEVLHLLCFLCRVISLAYKCISLSLVSAKYWIGLIFPDHNNYTHLITIADIGKGSGSLLSNKTGRAKEVVIIVSNIKKSRILEIWINPKISESFTMSQDILFFCVSSVSRSKINPRPGHGFRNKTPKESSSSHLSFSAILSLSHQNGSV